MKTYELEIKVDGVTTTKILIVDDTLGPVGCVDIKYKGRRTATIRQLFVRPACRGRGIAKTIIERCLELASQERCEALSLCLAKDNTAAWYFYIKRGFQLAWQDDDGEMIMTKSLKVPAPEVKLWPKRDGMRQSILGVLVRLEPILKEIGDPAAYASVLEKLRTDFDELQSRFYSGDISVVDEFLQLYDLDTQRAEQQRIHTRKVID